jgi:NitT/TauT family transport system ATP-binding protein
MAPSSSRRVSPTTTESVPRLAVEDLGVSFGAPDRRKEVIGRLDFDVAAGQVVCIVGPSGVGKTSLLRCLTGLMKPTRGSVRFDGTPVAGTPDGVAVVFQDYSRSLLPWRTAARNVELPLQALRWARSDRRAAVAEALAEVGLEGADGLHPWQMSGGMQQRVAIARAIVTRPKLLVMDEPFASVDAQTRSDLEDLTLRIRDDLGMTIIVVTHDIDEAVYLADRVVVLSGRPARLATDLEVPLGGERDQIRTKAEPEFADLRSRLYTLVRS